MSDVRRVWLVGTLVLAVAVTATASATAKAPVSAQSLPGQGAFEQACASLGGTFSLKELGGPAQRYECEGVPQAAQALIGFQVCETFPDNRESGWSPKGGGPLGTLTCTRSGVANFKVTVDPKVRIVNSSQLVVQLKGKCFDPLGVGVFGDVSVQISQPGGSGTGSATVRCDGDWTTAVFPVTGGPFTPGQADVTAVGTQAGVMGDRDVRQLQLVSG